MLKIFFRKNVYMADRSPKGKDRPKEMLKSVKTCYLLF